MGTDKWEHFFQQGYWLWDLAYGDAMASLNAKYPGTTFPDFTQLSVRTAFSEWLEGTKIKRDKTEDPLVTTWGGQFEKIAKFEGIKPRMGIYGAYSTGVISYADMCANEQGFQFYNSLYNNSITFKFSTNNYDLLDMNEWWNSNVYVNGITFDNGA